MLLLFVPDIRNINHLITMKKKHPNSKQACARHRHLPSFVHVPAFFTSSIAYSTLVAFALLLLVFTPSGVGSNRGYGAIKPDVEDAIDDFVQETLSCREIVGMNLAVVRGNKTLLAKVRDQHVEVVVMVSLCDD